MTTRTCNAHILAALAALAAAYPAVAQVKISQVYGGGRLDAGGYNADYVELLNTGAVAASLNGWSLQGATTAGSTAWTRVNLPNVSIQPNRYFLIRLEATGTPGQALPTPDFVASPAITSLASTAGKIALVRNTTTLPNNGCPIDPNVIEDLVSYVSAGSPAALCYEGATGNAYCSSGGLFAVVRKCGGLIDANDNRNDFDNTAPQPHNSASPGPGGLLVTGSAVPPMQFQGGAVTFNANASACIGPPSSGQAATINLTPIGGAASVPMTAAGGGNFTAGAVVGNVADGLRNCIATFTDAQGRSGAGAIPVTVGYCESRSTQTTFEYIQRVQIGTIDNTSTRGNYQWFGNLSANVEAPVGLLLTVTVNGPTAGDRCHAFVDWNADGDLTDANELYALNGGGGPDNGQFSGIVAPPTGASLGAKRLRIKMTDSAANPSSNPCGTYTFGETEDYTLTVVPPTSLIVVCNAASPASVSPGGQSTLSALVNPATTPPSTGIAVSVNLTPIGGPASQAMNDIGGNNWQFVATVSAGTSLGQKSLVVTVTDAQARNDTCTIDLNVVPPPPGNDTCSGAIAIPCDNSLTTDNTYALNEPNDPVYTCRGVAPAQGAGTVWFNFVATQPLALIDTEGSGVTDTLLAVYSGGCGGLSQIGCDDDGGSGLLSRVLVSNLTVGNTYIVQAACYSSQTARGNIRVNVTCTLPIEVTCNTAQPATVQAGSGVTLSAFVTPATAPLSTGLTVNADLTPIGGAPAAAMADNGVPPDAVAGDGVYTLAATVALATAPGPKSLTVTAADAQLRSDACNIALAVTAPPPPNDTCVAAQVIGPLPFSTTVNNDSAGRDGPPGSCNSGAAALDNSVWYSWTAPRAGPVALTVDPNAYDGVVVVFTGSCAGLTEVVCGDEPEPITVNWNAVLGVTYYIEIGDWGTTEGGGPTNINMTGPAPCPGDADADGDVDQDDLDVVLFNFGTTQPVGSGGDLDFDGDVDQDDLDTVLFYFGSPHC